MYREDKPREECGVFGIYAKGEDAARRTFFALYALQHRGHDGAGIVSCDGRMAHVHKGMGLVSQVFNEDNLLHLRGHMAIGHTRYSTTGSPHLRNTQPYVLETLDGPLAIGHNGNLINAPQLRRELLDRARAVPGETAMMGGLGRIAAAASQTAQGSAALAAAPGRGVRRHLRLGKVGIDAPGILSIKDRHRRG